MDLGPEHIVKETSERVEIGEEGQHEQEKEDHHIDGPFHQDGPEEFADRDPFHAIQSGTTSELSQAWKGKVHQVADGHGVDAVGGF